jgi:hypothetical protein
MSEIMAASAALQTWHGYSEASFLRLQHDLQSEELSFQIAMPSFLPPQTFLELFLGPSSCCYMMWALSQVCAC